MRSIFSCLAIAILLLGAACSTTQSRIEKNQAAFNQFPADVQQKIRAGQVDVGYTEEMVLMALGKPARKFTRRTETGDTQVWSYRGNRPRFSVGVGMGTFGRHSSVGGGVEMSTGGYDPDEKLRIEFRGGRVSVIDYVRK